MPKDKGTQGAASVAQVNAPKRCIFCDAEGMTHEHVWPEWLEVYVPKTLSSHTSLTGMLFKDNSTQSSIKSWSGDPRSRRVPVVCARCNGGWMSQVQTAVKNRLIPLLDGKVAFLRPYDQKILAAWATMCVMTGEYYSPEQAAIPFADREYLRLYRESPPGWRIWIGRYVRGKWQGYWVHHSLPILAEEDIPQGDPNYVPPPNTQMTTFVVGQLYIHAFSSATTDITHRWQFAGVHGIAKTVLAQIWPLQESFIAWPTEDIWDITADRLASYIFRHLHLIGRTFGH